MYYGTQERQNASSWEIETSFRSSIVKAWLTSESNTGSNTVCILLGIACSPSSYAESFKSAEQLSAN